MAYYKITKEQLTRFYNENVENSHLLPTQKISPINIERISKLLEQTPYIQYNKLNHENLTNFHNLQFYLKQHIPQLLNHFTQTIDNYPNKEQYIAKLQQWKFIPDNDIHNTQVFMKFSPSDNIQFIDFLENVFNKNILSDILLTKSYDNFFTYCIVPSFLITQEKIDNFRKIINHLNVAQQISIINIDFGDEHEVSLDPIVDIAGLNQTFAAQYLDIDSYIIQSFSQPSIIEKTIGKVSLASEEEARHIFNIGTNLSYLTLDVDLLLSGNLVNDFKVAPKEISHIEQITLDLTNESISSEVLFNHLLYIIRNEEYKKSYKQLTVDIATKLYTHNNNDSLDFETNYIKTMQKLFDNQEFSTIQALSPYGSLFKSIFSKSKSKSFFNNLLQELNPVRSAYLFFHTEYPISSKISDDITYLQEGLSLTINDFKFFDANTSIILKEILHRINDKDSSIYSQFQESEHFIPIQQDIYPLLSISEKLKPINYQCFQNHNFYSSGNIVSHISSIPLSLLDDKQIFHRFTLSSNRYYAMHNQHRLQPQSPNFKSFMDSYIPEIINYKLSNLLDDALNNNHNIDLDNHSSLNDFLNIFYKPYLFIQFDKGNGFQILEKLFLQKEKQPSDNICSNLLERFCPLYLEYISEHRVPVDHNLIFKISPFLPETSHNRYYETPIFCHYLNALFNDPKFDPQIHQKEILTIYFQDNNCLQSSSHPNVKKYFRKKEILSNIIQGHKSLKNISVCRAFALPNERQSIFTKNSMKTFEEFGLDIIHLGTPFLSALPQDIYNNSQAWKDNIKHLIYLSYQNGFKLELPDNIQKDYSFFSSFYSYFIQTSLSSNKSQDSIISRFPHSFIHRQESLVTLLTYFSNNYNYSNSYNTDLHTKLSFLGPQLKQSISQLLDKSSSDKHNYFQDAITYLEQQNISNISSGYNKVLPKSVNKF
jgi:hypothetical protein